VRVGSRVRVGRRRAYYNDGTDALKMSYTIPDENAAP